MTTTASALRAACAATPDERTTRLVLADLIGETDPLAAARFRCCVEPESDERRLQFADELERVDAEWAGVDDGGDQIRWAYDQRPGTAGVELRIEGAK